MHKNPSVILGAVFVLAGLIGFISNPIIGGQGYFLTNHLHDLVHIITGLVIAGLAVKAVSKLQITLYVLAAVYLVVGVLGFFAADPVGTGSVLGILLVNTAVSWLHIVFAVVLVALGWSIDKNSSQPQQPQM